MYRCKKILTAKSFTWLIFASLCSLSHGSFADMVFTGNLQDRLCQLAPSSAEQDVIFPQMTLAQFLDAPGRSPSQNFAIRLLNCQADAPGKVVKLIFSGQSEQSVPGAVKVSGVNSGKLVIQLVDTDGITPLALGEAHRAGKGDLITADMMTLNFSAYVRPTPDALAERSVKEGDYSAVVTFEINYQ